MKNWEYLIISRNSWNQKVRGQSIFRTKESGVSPSLELRNSESFHFAEVSPFLEPKIPDLIQFLLLELYQTDSGFLVLEMEL